MTKEETQQAFLRSLAPYPNVLAALTPLLAACSPAERSYLQRLYAGLGPLDLTGVSPQLLLREVRAALQGRRELSYAAQVPEELFCTYVIPPRVNNEWLDGSRSWLYHQLFPWVQGKSIQEAALAVNGWCSTQATYTLADDRTIGPLGMCRRGKGRCGEESTLLTAALRAVGIPARQVYAPYWAHCDDNHAWVEFWSPTGWHYLGGCEPEPVADAGWFTSAASRAMLIRAFAPDPAHNDPASLVNTTARYGVTTKFSLHVQRQGRGVAGCPVSFWLVNESRLCPIARLNTGADGAAQLEVGRGSLLVSAYLDGRWMEELVDTRTQTQVTLAWENGVSPLEQEGAVFWQLVPPEEQIPLPIKTTPEWEETLGGYEASRREKAAAYPLGLWQAKAAGNWQEIAAFLAEEAFSQEDKEALLDTLKEKDFADVTCAALTDALAGALPHQAAWPREVWKHWILAPRVEWEPMLPIRCELAALLKGEAVTDGPSVLRWMKSRLRLVPGREDWRGNALGYLRNGVCPKEEWNRVAVQLCRSVGIPARLAEITGGVAVMDTVSQWSQPQYPAPFVPLTLHFAQPLRHREYFTLSRWEGEGYRFLDLQRENWAGEETVHLPAGAYRLVAARRQIDGSVSAIAQQFLLYGPKAVEVTLAPDRTEEKLKNVPLPPVTAFALPDREHCTLAGAGERSRLLVLARPGMEPTEHLLQELLSLCKEYNEGGWPVDILLTDANDGENQTLQMVMKTLQWARCYWVEEDPSYHLRRAMGIGDGRLPLAIAIDPQGRGRYGCANYQIRSASTLAGILRLITEK